MIYQNRICKIFLVLKSSSTCKTEKGRNRETAATLKMIPKLALVVIIIYLIVYVKVVHPSRFPPNRTFKSVSSNKISAYTIFYLTVKY